MNDAINGPLNKTLRLLFFALVVRPVLLIVLGLNVRRRELLPRTGPAIIVANHNSHLDTMVLMTLLPLRLLPRIRPVASADYFLGNRFLAWFATKIIGIIPIPLGTGRPKEEILAETVAALKAASIIILFPEGTRGEPEKINKFKKGIATLCELAPDVPVYPVYLHGLGKALPKGEMLLVPFFCDVFVGEVMRWDYNKERFMQALDETMKRLAAEGKFAAWE